MVCFDPNSNFCTLKIRAIGWEGVTEDLLYTLVQIARMRKSRPMFVTHFGKIRENTESKLLLMFWKKLPMNNISNSIAIQSVCMKEGMKWRAKKFMQDFTFSE